LQFHTRKPVAAAQNPPTIQRTFFITLPPLCVLMPIFLDYLDYDAPRRLDAAKFWSVAGGGLRLSRVTRERLHFRVWIRFDSVVRLGLERV
jgi:hypothetical protein